MQKILSAAIGLCVALAASIANAEPVRPTDDHLVLLKVAATASRDDGLRALQDKLSANPDDLDNAIELARAAIEIGRSTGDPRAYGQAEAALAPWWSLATPPEQVLILRATIQQAFHAFAPALTDLDQVIASAPGNVQARFSRAFIHMVTGNYQSAAKDCAAMRTRAAILFHEICLARIGAFTGAGEQSYTRLQVAAQLGRGNPAMTNYANAVLAEIAVSLGDNDRAEALYRAAIAEGEPDVSILAAYADLLLTKNQPQKVLELLQGKGEADALVLRRAIAAKQSSDPRLAQWVAIQSERFAAAAASKNRVHLREEAHFRLEVLDDAKGALPLAVENWNTQKEPADARLLLAAALAAGDSQAAIPVRDFIKRNGLIDARLTPLLRQFEKTVR